LNLTISAIAPEKRIVLELVRWETHVHPGLGVDAQKVVNEQTEDYDIFVGVMWKRMGTPTTTAGSGTEEEFQRAYKKWQMQSLPVLFYFCQQPFAPPRSMEEVEQLGKVVAFRQAISNKGLVADYADHETFADVVRPHLLFVLGKLFSPKGTAAETAQRTGELTSTPEALSAVRAQILGLATEYEQIRRSMNAGDERTRQMEIVASKMRSFALLAYPLLDELVGSASAGQRLAAISVLESIPTPKYLPWLAERVAVEQPFVAYHATVALLNAARNLRASNAREVKKAIDVAWENLSRSAWKDPNQIAVLENAKKELNWVEESGDR
jgi:hypothetical protein